MKKVTYEQFLSFNLYWLETEDGRKRLRKYKLWWGDGKTALDVLSLEEVDADDKLCTVLRPEFIDELILHEFACRCAERALSYIDNPDPRSVNAIKTKRAWLKGEISDAELYVARDAAQSVAWEVSWEAAQSAAWDATQLVAQDAAWDVAWDATRFVSCKIGWDKERQWQIDELMKMLQK